MRWFRRKRGWVELGTYEPPEPTEPAAIESIVADGMLIAESLLRMTLRNHIIVDALRDGRDLNRDALAAAAAQELEALADQEWESAQRVRLRREAQRIDDPLQEDAEFADEYRRESQRRERVHFAMSDAFAARARERDVLDSLVERARVEAWEEIGPVIAARAMEEEPAVDESYAAERAERVAALLALDLTALAAERGVELI